MEVEMIIGAIREHLKRSADGESQRLKILEFGSGRGFQIPYLESLGELVASDVYMNNKLNLESSTNFVKCSISTAPFVNETFDVLFSNHVIEHIKDIDDAFLEMRRIGKDNCIYAFAVPTNHWLLLSVPAQYLNKVRKVIQLAYSKFGKLRGGKNAEQAINTETPESSAPSSIFSKIHYLLLPSGHGQQTGFFHC